MHGDRIFLIKYKIKKKEENLKRLCVFSLFLVFIVTCTNIMLLSTDALWLWFSDDPIYNLIPKKNLKRHVSVSVGPTDQMDLSSTR